MIARLFDRAACVVQGPCILWGAYLLWGEKEKLKRLNERVLPLPTPCGIWISEKVLFSLLHCLLLFVRQGIPPLVSSMGPLTKFRLHGRSSATMRPLAWIRKWLMWFLFLFYFKLRASTQNLMSCTRYRKHTQYRIRNWGISSETKMSVWFYLCTRPLEKSKWHSNCQAIFQPP